jgi:DNA-binding SARP family transcriptional activator
LVVSSGTVRGHANEVVTARSRRANVTRRVLVIVGRTRYNVQVHEFRILGPFEVLAADGEPLQLGGQRQRAVLVALLLRVNEVVSTDVLVDRLWGENPPRTARTSLQNAISALRQLLGPNVLVTRPPGYRLVVDPESIDLKRFERLVTSARTLDAEERADRLRDALALWRGEPLPEFRFEQFAAEEIFRLEELHLATLQDRIEADLACARFSEVVPELQALVAQHPDREQLWIQLMRALAYSGRRAEAAGPTFQAARRALDDRGFEPSAELRELQRQILNDELPQPRRVAAAADDVHFAEVAKALLGGRLVPVLGMDVGALAERLASRFEYSEDDRELTRVAQFVALAKGAGPLYEELQSLLNAAAAPTPVHRFFASLPPLLRERGLPHQLLVTTSYDLALEQALLDAGEEFDIVSYLASGRNRGRFCHRDPSGETRVIELPNTYAVELSLERRTVVLKLHGGLDETEAVEQGSFVVTEDDYIAYLARGVVTGAIPVALAAKLNRSHFLFLGYGMREWSLRLVLDRISGGEPLAYRSWAVRHEARPLEREFWRKRDVDLLEQPLEDYVEALGPYLALPARV